ncbi:YdcF family protein [uncultured Haemophilus sp.]|jgi:hypothetical protein|uniref:YdcF family protein n=1 Tax=uncultured Haemophilus sp. TaxID=237779 RepID=UPI0028038BB8|nr:YdcF family protein [uncultured Haemophilus sp.]
MRFLKMFGVLFSVWFFFATLFLTIGGIWDSGGKADAAIVFGADRNLSKTTKSRLDHSVELFKQQRVAHIVLMAMGEGESMKDYLLSKDIPADAIVLGTLGNDLQQTVKNSLITLSKNNLNDAITLAPFYQQTRIKMLFYSNHFPHVSTAGVDAFQLADIYGLGREFFIYYKERVAVMTN